MIKSSKTIYCLNKTNEDTTDQKFKHDCGVMTCLIAIDGFYRNDICSVNRHLDPMSSGPSVSAQG
jgi:hypothetical protein